MHLFLEPTELKNEEAKPESKSGPARPGSAVKSSRPRTGRLKSAARPPSARPAAPRYINEYNLEMHYFTFRSALVSAARKSSSPQKKKANDAIFFPLVKDN